MRANAIGATDAASSLAWSSAVRRSCRSRFNSSSGNVGRRTTSAINGSASLSRETGTFRRTADASNELLVASAAPRNSTSSATCNAVRLPAPSSSIAAVRLATPNLPAGSSLAPAFTKQIDLDERHFVGLDQPHRQSVRERPLLDRREIQRWSGAERRRLCCDPVRP